MQTQIINTTGTAPRTTTFPTIPSPFSWLRDLNATFIAYFRFKDLDEDRLRDMGITKRQQDDAFLSQFAPRNDR
ncbi:hypothetical protein [Oricola sp.]|uniref:hypothetical protein n=1 Tax=Oricola sp. TaxID=1979950 RepID=UPI0025FC6A87|nr:hypothetical protein [Oricola sp.]MCI5073440.1 hypothetical protein [Oricola sp.]